MNEMPSFAVSHRGVGYALEKMGAFLDRVQKFTSCPHVLATRISDRVKQAVELLPHFRADLFTHLTSVFASRHDTRHNGCSLGGVVQQRLDRNLAKLLVVPRRIDAQRSRQTHPIAIVDAGSAFQHQVELNLNDSRGMLGTFQIPAHPIKTLSDPGKHTVS